MHIEELKKARNTPTCVGKTPEGNVRFYDRQKHPHMRGEDSIKQLGEPRKLETPPHAWGRLRQDVCRLHKERNTPTCVGKTCFSF